MKPVVAAYPVFSMVQATNSSALGTPCKLFRHATGVTN
jgi:hypothetical protein